MIKWLDKRKKDKEELERVLAEEKKAVSPPNPPLGAKSPLPGPESTYLKDREEQIAHNSEMPTITEVSESFLPMRFDEVVIDEVVNDPDFVKISSMTSKEELKGLISLMRSEAINNREYSYLIVWWDKLEDERSQLSFQFDALVKQNARNFALTHDINFFLKLVRRGGVVLYGGQIPPTRSYSAFLNSFTPIQHTEALWCQPELWLYFKEKDYIYKRLEEIENNLNKCYFKMEKVETKMFKNYLGNKYNDEIARQILSLIKKWRKIIIKREIKQQKIDQKAKEKAERKELLKTLNPFATSDYKTLFNLVAEKEGWSYLSSGRNFYRKINSFLDRGVIPIINEKLEFVDFIDAEGIRKSLIDGTYEDVCNEWFNNQEKLLKVVRERMGEV
ncbi:MAG: hypothetical protein QW478_12140 [Candidatus Micrarchaeaceae archaeon]